MGDGVDAERLHTLGMLASAFAGRAVAVDALRPGDPSWTDGQTIFVDPSQPARTQLAAVAVQASMIAAGSLDPDVAASAGPPFPLGQALFGDRGTSRTGRQCRCAAASAGVARQRGDRAAKQFARRVAEPGGRQGSGRRSAAGVRCHPRRQIARRRCPRDETGRPGAAGARTAGSTASGAGRTR